MTQKTIALLGNQNSGKTTLFNALTGANQYVGNWPGVTVDRVVGTISKKDWSVVDLPGLYSLSPYSAEEIVSRNYLIKGAYDVVVNVVDATHLERGLSLTLELLATAQEKNGDKCSSLQSLGNLLALKAQYAASIGAFNEALRTCRDHLTQEKIKARVVEITNQRAQDEAITQG